VAVSAGVLVVQEPFELITGRGGEQLDLQEPGAAAARAPGAVALEFCDRACGVGLAIERRVAAGRGPHPFARGLRRRVARARLGRDQRRRVERIQLALATSPALWPAGRARRINVSSASASLPVARSASTATITRRLGSAATLGRSVRPQSLCAGCRPVPRLDQRQRRTRLIDQPLDPPQLVIDRHQVVQTDHLHLPGLLTRPDRERHVSHAQRIPIRPDETSTGS
jgi:hypothetical protein